MSRRQRDQRRRAKRRVADQLRFNMLMTEMMKAHLMPNIIDVIYDIPPRRVEIQATGLGSQS